MSGICGVLRLDGGPVDGRPASAMARALSHRGGDGGGVHVDAPAALAAVVRHDTPESHAGGQPLVGPAGIALVADARIDNRDELGAALGRPTAGVADADLILQAYLRWGLDAPSHLVGDFAFALWDPRKRLLMCARDAFGVRPLAYAHRPGRLLAFASESRALFALDDVPREVDERVLAAYLDGRDIPNDATFYRDVLRVPPAHRLVADDSGLRVERYWQPDERLEVRRPRPSDYVDAFRECFDAAVRARMRTDRPLGAMLSGGLDSSSIAATAAGMAAGRLPTFSYRFDSVRDSDEREFQDALLASGRFDAHFIRGDELDPFADLDTVVRVGDEPTGAGNLFLHCAAWRAAREAGVGVMLDGFFGDSAVTYGDDLLRELARRGRIPAFAREVLGRRRAEGLGWRMVASLISRTARAVLPQPRWAGTKVSAASPRRTVFVPLNPDTHGLLPPDSAAGEAGGFYTVRRRHVEDVAHEAYTPLFEVMNKASASLGVDVRFPFADRRLVEHSISLPPEIKQRDGRDRWVLRAAMAGRLPDAVRLRYDKGDLLPNLGVAMRGKGRARLSDELEDPQGPLARFVDRVALDQLLTSFDAGDSEPVAPLWTAVCASAWLRSLADDRADHEHHRDWPLPEA